MYVVDWRNTKEPDDLLFALRGRADQRKLRLYCCRCVRSIWDKLAGSDASCRAVEEAERFAEGDVSPAELAIVEEAADEAVERVKKVERKNARRAAACCAAWKLDLERNVKSVGWYTAFAHHHPADDERSTETLQERVIQAHLLRDIFPESGAPPAMAADDPLLHDALVQRLAQSLYTNRVLPAGNFDRAIVAELHGRLRQIGISDSAVLTHLESPHAHVRGCWVVDLILGKGESVVGRNR